MKKILLSSIFFLALIIVLAIFYLSTIGFETDKFNSLLEKNITSNVPNTKIRLNKIKIKINIKNLSFFVTTSKPNLQFYNNSINLKKIDAYVDLRSLLIGNPIIDKVNISSDEIDIKEIKNIAKYSKPSNLKRFFLNEVENGKTSFNLELNLKNNEIYSYEINGIVKNFLTNIQNINLKKTSFVYSIKKNKGELNNIRGYLNGFLVNSGSIEFDNSKKLNIKGNISADFNLTKNEINKLVNTKTLRNYKSLKLIGKTQNKFELSFDNTLKVINYAIGAAGNIQEAEIKLQYPQKHLFIKNSISRLNLEKTEFLIDFTKGKKRKINLSGSYKLNNNSLQKFELNNLYETNSQQWAFKGNFNNEIFLPFLNFSTKNNSVNINAVLETKKNKINLKKLNLEENKNKIDIVNLLLENNILVNFDKISVKTFLDGKFNNDFVVTFDKKIKITGSKYDASNLTKFLEKDGNSSFLKNVNKEISINIKEISTNVADIISNFNLIGNIEKGKFNKIVSKGEFQDGKYLDISLRADKLSNKKVLEIYSDLPKPLLSNFKFFKGLSGGQLLLMSSYDTKSSNTNLTIENFKVNDAPGLVKLLSLADFGGMVDALSGDGLSFEKLEMKMIKNDRVLNLTELYAIGPSISILMEGYVESKTGLVSLRGTMVPAKTLNKFLAKLPILGDILIPKEIGEGLFGVSFKMKGMPGKIKTTVNPIKTLTPRFIQKALEKTK